MCVHRCLKPDRTARQPDWPSRQPDRLARQLNNPVGQPDRVELVGSVIPPSDTYSSFDRFLQFSVFKTAVHSNLEFMVDI